METTPSPDAPFATVLHVDIAAPDPQPRTPDGPALVIAWSGGRAVAMLWVKPGDPADAVPRFLGALGPPPEPPALAAPPATVSPPTVSIVICTRDRPDELSRCLASLPLQSRRADEVIVVDNASRGEGTKAAARAAGVRYIREDRPGLDIARNTGLLAATSEIVAYSDDDTELHPRWLERICAAFDREDIMAVTGLVLPARLDTEAQWLFEEHWSFGRGFERIDFDQAFYRSTRAAGCPAWKVGAGANMAFRREIFDRIGLFDERLDVGAAGCSGDSEYWYRILAAGYTCRYEPAATLFHHHRLEMAGLESQIFHYMRGHVAALMVQWERTGDLGNLRRAFLTMPFGYARRWAGRLIKGRNNGNRLLRHQVSGAAAGLLYYLRAPRAKGKV